MSKNFLNKAWEKWNPGEIDTTTNITHNNFKKSDQVSNFSNTFTAEQNNDNLNNIKKNGYEDGFKRGKKEGFEAGFKKSFAEFEKKNREILNKMEDFLSNFRQSLSLFDEKVSSKIINTVLKISKKVLETTTLANDDSSFLKKIETIFQDRMFSLENPKLFISPNNQLLVKKYFGKIFSQYGWTICYNHYIPSGEFIISSGDTILDSTSSTRWNKLCKLVYFQEKQ
ncbi:Flagellar assembly protein FliH [Buchnera aphidicola str. Bp (Baizongia pistaciae)]|uniref:Flagellar assembly protein FliH n=1 Tax=Buchnera aphidicola subsp. Baizongia pistaciae (strain Bp) TaxID=224915 RepID=FLIH_BUCBP|nr:FliH/SctL family protein [Buchnera aphidicola]Q89AZ8.1 RecName: Full=Flagellar assembly protein FliH [Buchnera aphidicola str. Bp (Baizongia pistaciae)]AAO26806.1 Flagellar assembly protein FliH [Buchnera aphidicola str. Bp (Baizongia pistaciae)]